MKIFVGTLYTFENEIDECIESIRKQTYTNFKHLIFKGLPNKEAHQTLYTTFMNKADEFDLLIKVDADMVIIHSDLFHTVVTQFRNTNWLDELEIAVHDFFSDKLVWGMHVYRNSVRWPESHESLFVDSSPVPRDRHIYDRDKLAPAAIHCKNPSSFQSFHYGVHKALKVIQPERKRKISAYSEFHWTNISKTWHNFRRKKDKRLGLAVLGAELAFNRLFKVENIDYGDRFMKHVFHKYEHLDADRIEKEIWRLRVFNWGFLPGKLRRNLLCLLKGR